MKLKKPTINVSFLFPFVFYHYLKRNWNVLEINVLPKCMYSWANVNYNMHILVIMVF